MKLVLLGGPCAGKGTLSEYLRGSFDELNKTYLSTGGILKDLADEGSPKGIEARDKY